MGNKIVFARTPMGTRTRKMLSSAMMTRVLKKSGPAKSIEVFEIGEAVKLTAERQKFSK